MVWIYIPRTRSYWNKSIVELINMINQQGTPTFFFILSATHTKWLDLHALMPSERPTSLDQHHQWKIHNIISSPHIASQDMHNRFKIFLEEVLQKVLHVIDSWCKCFTISSFLSFSSCLSLHKVSF